MKEFYYKIVENGLLKSVWVTQGDVRLGYDFIKLTKTEYPKGIPCNVVIQLEKISADEFVYLNSIWQTLFTIKNESIKITQCCDTMSVNFEEVRPEVKKIFKPKTTFQLYNVSGSISIHGNSEKSMKELVDFFEIHGRKNGFRILGLKGKTTGFVHADLFNSLSYHIKPV